MERNLLMTTAIDVDGIKVNITNPEKVLWPELEIRKIDYIQTLIKLAPYILPHTKNRLLTTIRYPNNIHNKFFFQKKVNEHTPRWIERIKKDNDAYINLNNRATLIWLGNQAALELHTSFNRINENPTSLVFDLDPSEGQNFNNVIEVALVIEEELNKLNISSYPKTSGATGLQIYIPIESKYSFHQARALNEFFANFFAKKYPKLMTIERSVNKREHLLYFDYLQMWKGKTIISVYSPRAVSSGSVSTPVTWEEIRRGIKPSDFNLLNILNRLGEKGDLFNIFISRENNQNLDFILNYINK